MDFTSLTARIREWKSEMKQTLEASNSVPTATDSPQWYAGLAVSPAAFSRQLGDMQLSMLKENKSRENADAGSNR